MTQEEIYNIIIHNYSRKVPKSLQDLAKKMGFTRSTALLYHINTMIKKGLLIKVRRGLYLIPEIKEHRDLEIENDFLKETIKKINILSNL